MSAKIHAAMKKMDASLSLIAENFVAGKYRSESQLRKANKSVSIAVSNAKKAYAILSSKAKKGRSGLIAMATESFDRQMTAVQQCLVKATLLAEAINAELSDMEDNRVTEDIEPIDFEGSVGEVVDVIEGEPSEEPDLEITGEDDLEEEDPIVGEDLEVIDEDPFEDPIVGEDLEVIDEDPFEDPIVGEDEVVTGEEMGDLFDGTPTAANRPRARAKEKTRAALRKAAEGGRRSVSSVGNLESCWDFRP